MFSPTVAKLFRLLQMGDSAFPIGGFSFSAGLEGAVSSGMVTTTEELSDYTRTSVVNAAHCDAIAALVAYRAISQSHLEELPLIDQRVVELKLSPEMRTMTLRTGSRAMGLLRAMSHSSLVERWAAMVDSGLGLPTLPVAQAVGGALFDIGEQGLFALHLYGTASVVLSASLRIMRVSHIDTQRILLGLAPLVDSLYNRYGGATLDDMWSFAPLLDVASSLHQQGSSRLFMN